VRTTLTARHRGPKLLVAAATAALSAGCGLLPGGGSAKAATKPRNKPHRAKPKPVGTGTGITAKAAAAALNAFGESADASQTAAPSTAVVPAVPAAPQQAGQATASPTHGVRTAFDSEHRQEGQMTMRSVLLVAPLVALSLAACSSGSRSSGASNAASATTSSVVASAAAPSPATAPSSASSPTATPARPAPTTTGQAAATTSPVPKKVLAPDLSAQVLQLSEMPTGWSVDKSASEKSSGSLKCFAVVDQFKVKVVSQLKVGYLGDSDGSPTLSESLYFVPGSAAADFAVTTASLDACGTLTSNEGKTKLSGEIGAMSFPSLGDASKAYQVNLTSKVGQLDVTVGFDELIVRVGDELMFFGLIDLGTPDIDLFQSYARKAIAKLPRATA
jgi:hypothetical protein